MAINKRDGRYLRSDPFLIFPFSPAVLEPCLGMELRVDTLMLLLLHGSSVLSISK